MFFVREGGLMYLLRVAVQRGRDNPSPSLAADNHMPDHHIWDCFDVAKFQNEIFSLMSKFQAIAQGVGAKVPRNWENRREQHPN